jgi:hypothetical protein
MTAPPPTTRAKESSIKHARRVLQAHPYYNGFVDYGDAEAYRREPQVLRADLARLDVGVK